MGIYPYEKRYIVKASFEWDVGKDVANQFKHGVSFRTARRAFQDSANIIEADPRHSRTEKRFYCYGQTEEGILTVRFTYRGTVIRIIGAGYWRHGRKVYEKKNPIY
jgi:uncharacterized DUF497 family protein